MTYSDYSPSNPSEATNSHTNLTQPEPPVNPGYAPGGSAAQSNAMQQIIDSSEQPGSHSGQTQDFTKPQVAEALDQSPDSSTSAEGISPQEETLLQRPESVILLIFVSIFMIWQLYVDLMEEVAPEGSLSGRALAQRLNVSRSTISRRKEREDFGDWSQQLDPDEIAWVYRNGAFYPQDLQL